VDPQSVFHFFITGGYAFLRSIVTHQGATLHRSYKIGHFIRYVFSHQRATMRRPWMSLRSLSALLVYLTPPLPVFSAASSPAPLQSRRGCHRHAVSEQWPPAGQNLWKYLVSEVQLGLSSEIVAPEFLSGRGGGGGDCPTVVLDITGLPSATDVMLIVAVRQILLIADGVRCVNVIVWIEW